MILRDVERSSRATLEQKHILTATVGESEAFFLLIIWLEDCVGLEGGGEAATFAFLPSAPQSNDSHTSRGRVKAGRG